MSRYIQRITELGWSSSNTFNEIDSGWSNTIVEVSNRQIFRFPRKLTPQFEVEKAFLTQFAPISPIQIPKLESSPADLMTYPRIDGERFDPHKFWQLSLADQDKMIEQLAGFLTDLHSFNFDHPHLTKYPYGGADFWLELWPFVAPNLSDVARINAKTFFEQIINQVDLIDYKQTIVHADLGTNNTLADFTRAKITGIIDFSDMCWGDPAADFASFYRHFGKSFAQKLIDSYQRPIEDNFWPRIKFQANRKPFFVAYFAQNFGFQEHLPQIMNSIEQQFIG